MNDLQDLPGDWIADEPNYDFQLRRWVNGANGNELIIEQKEEPWHGEGEEPDLSLALLPPDPEDETPIRTIIEKEKDVEKLLPEALDHMEREAQRQG